MMELQLARIASGGCGGWVASKSHLADACGKHEITNTTWSESAEFPTPDVVQVSVPSGVPSPVLPRSDDLWLLILSRTDVWLLLRLASRLQSKL